MAKLDDPVKVDILVVIVMLYIWDICLDYVHILYIIMYIYIYTYMG